jgi:hypothetical protein
MTNTPHTDDQYTTYIGVIRVVFFAPTPCALKARASLRSSLREPATVRADRRLSRGFVAQQPGSHLI